MSETAFRKRVLKDLQQLDNVYIETVQQKAINGSPDYLLCCNSLFVGLELKDEDGVVSKLQEYKLKQIRRCGGIDIVARPSTWKEDLAYLRRLADAPRER